jgi:hypothetical protein
VVADPTSVQAQGDLIYGLGHVADTLSAQGAPGAAGDYTEALGIARHFAANHPTSIPASRTIAVLMVKLAAIPGAGVSRTDVVAFLDAARAEGMLSADDQKWLATYRQQGAAQAQAQPQGGAK